MEDLIIAVLLVLVINVYFHMLAFDNVISKYNKVMSYLRLLVVFFITYIFTFSIITACGFVILNVLYIKFIEDN